MSHRADRVRVEAGGGGHANRGGVPEDERIGADVFSVEEEVCGDGCVRRSAVEAGRVRKPQAEDAGGGPEPGQADSAGCHEEENLTPDRRRSMVDRAQQVYRVCERRACRVLQHARGTQRYESVKDDQAALCGRIKERAGGHVTWGYLRVWVSVRWEKSPHDRERGRAEPRAGDEVDCGQEAFALDAGPVGRFSEVLDVKRQCGRHGLGHSERRWRRCRSDASGARPAFGEQHALVRQQPVFAFQAAAVAHQVGVGSDYAVARHNDGDRVGAVGHAHGPAGPGTPDRDGDLLIGRGGSGWNRAERSPDLPAEIGARGLRGDRVDGGEIAGEVVLEPRGESARVAGGGSRVRRLRRERRPRRGLRGLRVAPRHAPPAPLWLVHPQEARR